MIDLSDHDKIQRGHDARYLLEQKLFIEAFARLESDTVDNIVSAPTDDDKATISLAERLRVIRDLKRYLENVAMVGRETQKRLDGQGQAQAPY